MPSGPNVNAIIEAVKEKEHEIKWFQDSVEGFFNTHPDLIIDPVVVHSTKARYKNYEHLKEKIKTKSSENRITVKNVFEKITDIAGVRVLHLYQGQFPAIHYCIMDQVNKKDWALYEDPKAYTWDPDSVEFFEGLGLDTIPKPSSYTSVHYVVKPKEDSYITCEIQVRTLFEEIWGEIDHRINYPKNTNIKLAKEQIRILSRLVGAGSRLADSIFLSVDEYQKLVRRKKKKKSRKVVRAKI